MANFFTSSIKISEGVLPNKKVYLDSNAAGLVKLSNNSTTEMWNFRPIPGKVLQFNIVKNSLQGEGQFLKCTPDGLVTLADQNGSQYEQWQLAEYGKFYTIENIKGNSDGLKFLGCKPDGDVAMLKDGDGVYTRWMIETLEL